MTTIRAVPPTPTDSIFASDTRTEAQQQQSTVDPYAFALRESVSTPTGTTALAAKPAFLTSPSEVSIATQDTSSKRNRGLSEAPRSRFSFVAVPYEKTRKAFTDLALREKTSQSSLAYKAGPGRQVEEKAAAASPTASIFKAAASTITTAHSPRDSFSSAAPSPRAEYFLDEPRSPRLAIDSIARPSIDRQSVDLKALAQQGSQSSLSQGENGALPNKMHQTSSRLLRMTDDERPYTKDFMDLFSTLVVSLPLIPHRIRFQRFDHSFSSEEAINNLGSLKFSQSNRMPDPKDPSRIVTTTTTTTFSMAKEMARAVCQRFLEARFIEPADGKSTTKFELKGPVWLLTPKGIAVLQRFCQRNGIQARHVLELIESPRNTMNLLYLERDFGSDRLSHDQSTVEVIFRRFAGLQGPNIRAAGTEVTDSEQVDYYNGAVGVRQAERRAVGNKIVRNTFTGKGAVDWLMDCTSIIDRRETVEIASQFIQQGLMETVVEDKVFMKENIGAISFQPTRSALYTFTSRGRQMAGHETKSDAEKGQKSNGAGHAGDHRKTNNNRLAEIVEKPSLRLLFREYLRTTHCEENLSFYLEVKEFTDSYDQAEKAKMFTRNDAIRENLAAAYGLYNAYLAPGSPNELNIDHNLRNGLASRMTRAVGDDDSMLKSLQEVVDLFREAQNSVFKLMSSDSVPKFVKDPKFSQQLREQNFEQNSGDRPRSASPSAAGSPTATSDSA